MKQYVLGLIGALFLSASIAGGASATLVMPDFADVPTGWVTDRYDPHSFSNVGTYQGHTNVLGIEINTAEGFGSRSPGYNTTFHNTHGRQHLISGGAGSVISADLYIPAAWGDPSLGSRRTDMWGVMMNPFETITAYPIIGFTNFGGAPRLRVWDSDSDGGWTDLPNPVAYDAWTTLAIGFTGSAFEYFVNDVLVHTDTEINTSTEFSAVIIQAYNFNGIDPVLDEAVAGDPFGNYTAYWSNTGAIAPVPEPVGAALFLTALPFIGLMRRRNRPESRG